MLSFWLITLVCALSGAVAQDASTARGTHLSSTGPHNLNLTLSVIQGTASGSSPLYCTVGGLLEPYTSYADDGAQPEANKTDPIALLYVDVGLGDSAGVTFYGGNVTIQGAPASSPQSSLVYTVSNSTDTGSNTGPLYITKGALATPNPTYRLDYAQFFPQSIGQSGWFAGGLGEVGAAPACIYNITFLTVAKG